MDPRLIPLLILAGYVVGALRWHWRMKRLVNELLSREEKADGDSELWKNKLFHWLERRAMECIELAPELEKRGDEGGAEYQRGKGSAFRAVLSSWRGWI